MKNPSELQELSCAIQRAKETRHNYIVEHMDELADFQIGERIFAKIGADDYKIRPAGTVIEHYIDHDGYVQCRFKPVEGYPYGDTTDGQYSIFVSEDQGLADIENEQKRQRNIKW